jgi:hypothetical protein
LACESDKIDEITGNELNLLASKKIPIKYIVPDSFNRTEFSLKDSDVFRYNLHSANLIQDLSATISEINNHMQKEDKSKIDSTFGIVIAALNFCWVWQPLQQRRKVDLKYAEITDCC